MNIQEMMHEAFIKNVFGYYEIHLARGKIKITGLNLSRPVLEKFSSTELLFCSWCQVMVRVNCGSQEKDTINMVRSPERQSGPNRPMTDIEKQAHIDSCNGDEDVGAVQAWLDELGNEDAEKYEEWRENALAVVLEHCLKDGHPKSPEDLKEELAIRLGRTRAGLENYVSEWRRIYRQDLPWVVRHTGLPWIPDVTQFETWIKTSEGVKAVVKRQRGRPPKTPRFWIL